MSSRLTFLPSAPTSRAVNQSRRERRPGRGLEMSDERPVFACDELLDLQLAVADQPQRHRLDATGRTGAGQLAP